MWQILNDPCSCIEQLDITLKPANALKGMKVYYTHRMLPTCFHVIFMYQCFVAHLPEDSHIVAETCRGVWCV
jgi:hypothetical protein